MFILAVTLLLDDCLFSNLAHMSGSKYLKALLLIAIIGLIAYFVFEKI